MLVELFLRLIEWFFLWFLIWGGAYGLEKIGIDYFKRYYFVSAYFLAVSIGLMFIFYNDLFPLVNFSLAIIPFILIPVTFIINVLAYAVIRRLPRPIKFLDKYSKVAFIKHDYRFLASKSFEILYQQILIALLAIWLYDLGLPLYQIVILFAIIFGLGHVYLLIDQGKFFGLFFTIASILSSVVFPVLILKVEYGFVYSYVIHWLFYIISGIYFWTKYGRQERMSSHIIPLPFTVGVKKKEF